MTRIIVLIVMLLPCNALAGYTIIQLPKITPQYVVVDGPNGTESRLNPGEARPKPAGGVRVLYADYSDLYGNDPTKRVELWEDTAGTATDAEIFDACPGLRDDRAARIRAEGNTRLLAIANPYQPSERETWPVQMSEAEAWLKDSNAATPMVNAIAAGRSIDKSLLITYIMENTNVFRQASGVILGQQQALLMTIYSATTVDALLAVVWP
jgi:hypothetical protein